jgi:tetratricopeptide (TPR) repeat protein
MTNLTVALEHFSAQQPEQAIAICDRLLALEPNATGPITVRALCLAMRGDYAAAETQFIRLIELEPNDSSHYINLAATLKDQGRPADAFELMQNALNGPADSAALRFEIAIWQMDGANYLAACKLLEPLFAASPADAFLRALFARCLIETASLPRARQVLLSLKDYQNADVLTKIQAGIAFMQLDKFAEAEALFRQALALDPEADDASYNLLALFERSNQMDLAVTLLAQLPVAQTAEQSLLRAKVLRRTGQVSAALQVLRAIDSGKVNSRTSADVNFALASIEDQSGHFDAAMQALDRAHAAQLSTYKTNHPDRTEMLDLRWVDEKVSRAQVEKFATSKPNNDSPTFLVGFMRSGTTLIEQMLAAHPQVVTLDEKPAIESVVLEIRRLGLRYPQDLDQFNSAELDALRAVYFTEVDRHIARPPNTHLVDKYPFNLGRLGLIRLLFPSAKVIFALRHPCDVVMSSVMQHFKINSGTVAFNSIFSAANTYSAVMSMWIEQSEICGLDTHTIRYESLVQSPEASARAMLEHLGLAWSNAVLIPNKQAKDKFISTPSYSQVATPIHQRSVERWRNYQHYFEHAMPLLRPWVERFQYSC